MALQPASTPGYDPTRAAHLAWCKQRAMEYIEAGDAREAWISFASDMAKHDGTRNHPALMLGMMQLLSGLLSTPAKMREWIEGFN